MEVFEEMIRMTEGRSNMTPGEPVVELDWAMFGYHKETNNYEGCLPTFQGWECSVAAVVKKAGTLANPMQLLIQAARKTDDPRNVIIATGLAKAIEILAGGHVPVSVQVAHACKIGLRFTYQSDWAIPQYTLAEHFDRPGSDLLTGVLNLLESLKLRVAERPAAPTLGSLAVYRNLQKSTKVKNWEAIMLDGGARQAFYEVTGVPLPRSIDTSPERKEMHLDNFVAFWAMGHWMDSMDFKWCHEIDVAMLPMDIGNPKGAE